MKIKVQICLSDADPFSPMMIYNQGRDFTVLADCKNIVGGKRDYKRLYNLVKTQGCQGQKAYFDAYVKEDGLLRVLLNNVVPLLKW